MDLIEHERLHLKMMIAGKRSGAAELQKSLEAAELQKRLGLTVSAVLPLLCASMMLHMCIKMEECGGRVQRGNWTA